VSRCMAFVVNGGAVTDSGMQPTATVDAFTDRLSDALDVLRDCSP